MRSTWQGIAAAVLSSRATRPKFKNIQSPSGNGDPHPEQKNGAIKSGRCHPLPPCTRDAYRWQHLLQVLHHALNSCQEEFKLETGAKNQPSNKRCSPICDKKEATPCRGRIAEWSVIAKQTSRPKRLDWQPNLQRSNLVGDAALLGHFPCEGKWLCAETVCM